MTELAFNVDLNSATGIILAILSIVVLVAAALVVGRATLVKAQLEALRGDRDDLVERVNRIESENTLLKAELKEEIGKRTALEKVITGSETLNQIVTLLERFDARAQHMDIRLILLAQKLGVNYEPTDPTVQPFHQ